MVAVMQVDKNIYNLLADVLEYPTSSIGEQAMACRAALETTQRQAYKHLGRFVEFCGKTTPGRIEEFYTDTFDIEAVCSPYVGFHLFGEDRVRGTFMVRLKEHYAREGYQPKGELPDHISVMLRFLSSPERSIETRDLIGYCLIPAVKKMASLFKNNANAYREVIEAVLVVLETEERGHIA